MSTVRVRTYIQSTGVAFLQGVQYLDPDQVAVVTLWQKLIVLSHSDLTISRSSGR